ncbi:hypothetical protein HU200_065621 [Digitaria exilis]|uniref:Bidirectional sugar transporter SWEET n=1 Tax=Digitaria exilis TaxID=1010633 RepID=A0A835A3N3_9POAL|nr:hypothetical protein HU200_065621 [Digitaria exilis]
MMSAATVHTVLGVVGNVIALVRYLSPVPTFYHIWKNGGSVERYSAAPYLATLLNCMLWMLYGLPAVQPGHSDLAIIAISATGIATQCSHITIFLAFSSAGRRRLIGLILVATVAVVGAVAALVLSLAHTHGSRAMIVGLIMVVFGTGMYASPLTVMEMVIQTKSVEYMPLFLSITLLLINSICWTAYALVLRFDLYLSIANGLGVIFSVAQLILYAVYYKSTLRIIEARNAGPSSATATAAVSH